MSFLNGVRLKPEPPTACRTHRGNGQVGTMTMHEEETTLKFRSVRADCQLRVSPAV